jgi:hypothetical protein
MPADDNLPEPGVLSEDAVAELDMMRAMYAGEDELSVRFHRDHTTLSFALSGPPGVASSLLLDLTLPAAYPAAGSAARPSLRRARLANEGALLHELRRVAHECSLAGEVALFLLLDACTTYLAHPLPCAVCLDPVGGGGAGDSSTTLPCHHAFHRPCLAPWIWRLVENARASTAHVDRRHREAQHTAAAANEATTAAAGVRALEAQADAVERRLAELGRLQETLEVYLSAVENAGGGGGKGKGKGGGKGPAAPVPVGLESDSGELLTVQEVQRRIAAAQTEARSIAKVALPAARARAEKAAAAAAAVAAGGGGDGGGTASGSTSSSSSSSLDEHLFVLRSAGGGGGGGGGMGGGTSPLHCPSCRSPFPLAGPTLAWYEGWARKEHEARSRADAESGDAPTPATRQAGAGGGVGAAATVSSSTPFDANPPLIPASIAIPDAVTDPETRVWLQGFGEEWLRRFKAAAAKGGIIGVG